jgi:V/A-type H+-transporting ATPase subunit D
MAELRGLPPGRAGRMWIRRRLATAQRGAALLDRKLRILRGEQARLRRLTERTGREWAATCAEAERWLIRAAILGGERELRLSTSDATAQVNVEWKSVMGVRYPASAQATILAPELVPRAPGTSAVHQAAAAYAVAVQAAAAHAAATAALLAVDVEVAATAQRLRAISDRWIPRLEQALAGVSQRLDEAERDETIRLRWAAGLRGTLRQERG